MYRSTEYKFHQRFRLLAVKRIDLATGEHVSKYKILENLYSLNGTSFVVVPKRVKEIFTGAVPLTWQILSNKVPPRRAIHTFAHPHFPTAFLDHTHDTRMRDGRTKGNI